MNPFKAELTVSWTYNFGPSEVSTGTCGQSMPLGCSRLGGSRLGCRQLQCVQREAGLCIHGTEARQSCMSGLTVSWTYNFGPSDVCY